VSGYEPECIAEEMMISGHSPDAYTLSLMMRVLATANARGQTGVLDVARILERGLASKVVGDEELLVQTLAAAEAAAQFGGVSLGDAQQLLGRACAMGGTADGTKRRVLGRLLRVAGAAAPHGLATVVEAIALVERLMQSQRESAALARLDADERDALVAVLASAVRAGTATTEHAERVMRQLDAGGERPSMRVLSVLLDVVLAEAARGQATLKDAAHVMNRIKGCGFEISRAEMSKMLSIAHASAKYGQADLSDAVDALRDLHACDPTPYADDYLQVLDCAQWAAFWRVARHAAETTQRVVGGGIRGATSALTSSPAPDDEWSKQMWARSYVCVCVYVFCVFYLYHICVCVCVCYVGSWIHAARVSCRLHGTRKGTRIHKICMFFTILSAPSSLVPSLPWHDLVSRLTSHVSLSHVSCLSSLLSLCLFSHLSVSLLSSLCVSYLSSLCLMSLVTRHSSLISPHASLSSLMSLSPISRHLVACLSSLLTPHSSLVTRLSCLLSHVSRHVVTPLSLPFVASLFVSCLSSLTTALPHR